MSITEALVDERVQRFRQAARGAGIRLTHQRLEIFREVAATEDHPDAETVFRGVRGRMPTVSLDTVYRTLWLLEELGLVTALAPRHDRTRFDANLDSHHHFVCERCGLICDLQSSEYDALAAPEEVKKLGTVSGIHVEVRGLCRECAARLSAGRDPDGGREDGHAG